MPSEKDFGIELATLEGYLRREEQRLLAALPARQESCVLIEEQRVSRSREFCRIGMTNERSVLCLLGAKEL